MSNPFENKPTPAQQFTETVKRYMGSETLSVPADQSHESASQVGPIIGHQGSRPTPIKAAHELLLTKLAALTDFMPRISIDPNPREFEDVNDYIIDAARMFDEWLSAIGVQIKANASCRIDESVFKDRFVNAVEGEATAEITRCAERVREDRAA